MKKLLVVLLLLVASPVFAGLCPGDSFQSTAAWVDVPPCAGHASATVILRHSASHSSCNGMLWANISGWMAGSKNTPISNSGQHASGLNVYRNSTRNGSVSIAASFAFYGNQGDQVFSPLYRQNYAYCPSGPPPPHDGCGPGRVECDSGCCPDPCPIIIDRDKNGVPMSSAEDGALVDINGRGDFLWLGWPTNPKNDPWLALDRNNNGRIDDGSELFGNTRYLLDGSKPTHGYEVLAELDFDRSGSIDLVDPAFRSLVLWADSNRDGLSQPSELSGLAVNGVLSISTKPKESDFEDKNGNKFKFWSRVQTRNGPTRSVDVFPDWIEP